MRQPQCESGSTFGVSLRAVTWLRIALLVLAAVMTGIRLNESAHPAGVIAVVVVMAAWTVGCAWGGCRSWANHHVPLTINLVVSLICTLASRPLLGAGVAESTGSSLAGLWQLGAPVSVALVWGPCWGLAASVLVGAATVCQFPWGSLTGWTQGALIVIVTAFVGAVAGQLRDSQRDRDSSLAAAAALAERERLSRIVHDGALQVLALIEREGHELGARGQVLAGLAREQESKLRALLNERYCDEPLEGSTVDIAAMLEHHQSGSVTVSTMAHGVRIDAGRAAELNAAVTEALLNVHKHAGPGARAWVLLELERDRITVSIRDDGVGFTAGQLERAHARGRLGVKESIRGRIAAIGGSSTVASQPGRGVEWEFTIPVEQRSE